MNEKGGFFVSDESKFLFKIYPSLGEGVIDSGYFDDAMAII